MPKATLEFNLPEEQGEFEVCVKGQKYLSALWDFSNYLRQQVKHGDLHEEDLGIYEDIQKVFYEIIGNLLED